MSVFLTEEIKSSRMEKPVITDNYEKLKKTRQKNI
ncbi:hypothetical protein BMS3Abin15_00226 [bacterium BMS3Abin15]|nr:hypothetical protein BMS3Abin15_00226 [bacterium BMS3Abin15]